MMLEFLIVGVLFFVNIDQQLTKKNLKMRRKRVWSRLTKLREAGAASKGRIKN